MALSLSSLNMKLSSRVGRSAPAVVAKKTYTPKSRMLAVRTTAQVGVFYSSSTGHTEEMAGYVQEALGDASEPMEVGDLGSIDEISTYTSLVVGAPTWHTGADVERSGTSWDDYLDTIAGMAEKLSGKPVAVFGLGDSQGYSENFCDAIEEIHDTFAKAGCKMVGYTDPSTYEFIESKSVRDGKFLGLPLDYENDYDGADDRIAAWVSQLKSEGLQ